MLFNHIAQRSTKAEGLCNSILVQNVAWITDRCIETKYNEPCDNAFQPTLERFSAEAMGTFFPFGGMSERRPAASTDLLMPLHSSP